MDEKTALIKLVDAWEALPGPNRYKVKEVEEWLAKHMAPAIRQARLVLGRPTEPSH